MRQLQKFAWHRMTTTFFVDVAIGLNVWVDDGFPLLVQRLIWEERNTVMWGLVVSSDVEAPMDKVSTKYYVLVR